jgi:hypothetical protein
MSFNRFMVILTLLYILIIIPLCACATEKIDILSGLNTLPLLINKINGDTTIAIVFDSTDSPSRADAFRIKAMIDAGMQVPGGGRLSAMMVSVNDLGKLSRAQIAFITPGLEAHFTDISTATSAASILTITTDIECVRAAKCIVGISTKPSLTIYYSKPAADSAKIEFSQAFSMLVKQP